MKFLYGKFFRVVHDNDIIIKKFDPTITSSYYSLIKEQQKSGYVQVILTSTILFSVLTRFQSKTDYRIEKFQFVEDDMEFSDNCENLIANINTNKEPLDSLFKYIDFLTKCENIEVQSVLLNRNYPLASSVELRSNGVVRIDESNFDDVQRFLCIFVKEAFL